MNEFNVPESIVWLALAVLGGIARYLSKFLVGQETLTTSRIIATIFVTGFSGYMTAQVMLLVYPPWTVVGAGVGGWAGTQMMDVFVDFVKYKVQAKQDEKKE